ncbi:MAG: FAD-dependent oxidoreductase [Carboxylicivirga sp.]|jgi:ferredoxin-NADP reductase|nr:FAD-dependent oxidoreductase [Carboxylicivirga sp.]
MAIISKVAVVSVKNFGEEVREFILRPERYYYFDPGTFLQLSLEEPINNRWPDSRNFSIASAMNDDKTIRLIIRKIGIYTSRIFNELTEGATCYVKYSFGDFLLPFFDKTNPIVCIAGGTGIAPVLSFAEYLKQEHMEERMHVLYSAKNANELIGIDVLSSSIKREHINIHLTREKSEVYENGRITMDDVKQQVTDLANAHFYICGGESFTCYFKENLEKEGALNIYTDEW